MRALVTGAGGFLGKAIAKRLLSRGWTVRSLARGHYPELETLGVEIYRGDLAEKKTVVEAAETCDVVFHVAAKPGVWGPYEDYYRPNVLGTEHIVAACQQHKIRRLIYTSTPSVVHAGGDIEGLDESAPYAEHFATHYPKTKAIAEKLVLRTNSPELATVALRPHLIWGPEDNNLVPRIVQRARAGRLRLIGGGKKLIDAVYIDNAAEAHLLACDRLEPGAPCAGKAYFITQGEPLPLATLVNKILGAAGLPPVTRSVPPKVAYAVGAAMEFTYRTLNIQREPLMTRFVAEQLSTAHWYDISAAKRDLDYCPSISTDEGIAQLRTWFQSFATPPY